MELFKKKKADSATDVPKPQLPSPSTRRAVHTEVKAGDVSVKIEKHVKGATKASRPEGKPSVTVSIFNPPESAPGAAGKGKKSRPQQKSPKPRKGPEKPAVRPAQEKEAGNLKDSVKSLEDGMREMESEIKELEVKLSEAPSKSQIEDLKKIVVEKADILNKFPKDDLKALKVFIGKSGSMENQISGMKAQLDKSLNVLDMFTEKVNSLEKALADAKLKKMSGAAIDPQTIDIIKNVQKDSKDIPSLKARMQEMEEAIDKLTDMISKAPLPPARGGDKSLADKITKLENSQKEMEEAIDKLTDLIKSTSRPERGAGSGHSKELVEKLAKLEYGQKDIPSLKAMMQEMEEAVDKLTDMADAPASGIKGSSMEADAMLTRMNVLEDTFKGMNEKVRAIDTDVSDIKKLIEEASKDDTGENAQTQIIPPTSPSESVAPDLKSAAERLDSMDSRITGISDKLVQVSADVQKISDYIMEGIKYIESRIAAIEKEMDSRQKVPSRPQPRYIPSTYSSHLQMKHELPEGGEIGPEPVQPKPPRQYNPTAYKPQPVMLQLQSPKPSVIIIDPNAPPSPPMPSRGPQVSTIFTKLREGTVVKRPYPNVKISGDMHDIDVLKEHIMEGARRQETREKMTQDLLNAGFDQDMIDRAFLEARVEN
jgi:chromosome segregation ATPase